MNYDREVGRKTTTLKLFNKSLQNVLNFFERRNLETIRKRSRLLYLNTYDLPVLMSERKLGIYLSETANHLVGELGKIRATLRSNDFRAELETHFNELPIRDLSLSSSVWLTKGTVYRMNKIVVDDFIQAALKSIHELTERFNVITNILADDNVSDNEFLGLIEKSIFAFSSVGRNEKFLFSYSYRPIIISRTRDGKKKVKSKTEYIVACTQFRTTVEEISRISNAAVENCLRWNKDRQDRASDNARTLEVYFNFISSINSARVLIAGILLSIIFAKCDQVYQIFPVRTVSEQKPITGECLREPIDFSQPMEEYNL